ncbi:MAG TPA: DUF6186 family protein [Actinomycetota bacterium]|nr:DUF6186 family protein [Actinomycetota bacterium]
MALVGWAVVAAIVLGYQGLALASGPGFPTISDLLGVVTRSLVGRWVLFALWLWLGWHLFVRGWRFFLQG